MNLDDRLQNVAVIGAGGKMGSGISLLLAREMTACRLRPENSGRRYRLTLMDVSPAALQGLQSYLAAQAARYAQKNAEQLRSYYPQAGSDEELQKRYQADLAAILHTTTNLKDLSGSMMVFEAILEKFDLKLQVYRQLKALCPAEAFFFSNTSSIPLKELDEQAGLQGRIIGFHFYNPPAVQRLVELIIPEKVAPGLEEISRELGKRLGKIIVPSNDVAGFIGNGHFIRDGLFGLETAERLAGEMSFVEAVYTVNRVTQEFLLRPMGIFQLIDYVGLDIFQSILKIMAPHFPAERLHSDLIDSLVAAGIKGGQHSDGSQKDGFLHYAGGQPAGIYDHPKKEYVLFSSGEWKEQADRQMGALPAGHAPWKSLVKDPDRETRLKSYFAALKAADTPGARLARQYLKRSREIGRVLLDGRVARSAEDVNAVLMNGFFHLYGPINDFV